MPDRYPFQAVAFGVAITNESLIKGLAGLPVADLFALIGQIICSHDDDGLAEKLAVYCQEFERHGIWPSPTWD
jgi:hypothetical protein